MSIEEAALAASSLIALTSPAMRKRPRRFGPWLKERPAGDGLERVSGGGPAREQALRQRRLRAGEAGVVVGLNGPDAPIGSNHNGA
jgi:hypothetical protein